MSKEVNEEAKSGLLRDIQTHLLRYACVFAGIGVITAVDFKLHVNHTTVALMFLVTVLLTSAYWGLRYAVVMAVGATAAFNFSFCRRSGLSPSPIRRTGSHCSPSW